MFFSRDGSPLNLVGLHRNASAFLIAGGPSFADVDKTKLRGTWTMTLNNAVVSYRSTANCVVDFPSRFSYSMWLDPTIQKFVPMARFEWPLWDNRLLRINGEKRQQWKRANLKAGDCPNVVGYVRNVKFDAVRFLYEDTVNIGSDPRYGGSRSVMLAALRILFLLGFRQVYLLGVDFEMSSKRKYHFPQDRTPGKILQNMKAYEKLRQRFAELQPYFLAEDFIVRNCNPVSKLEVFPYMPLDEAVEETVAHFGDYAHERTAGMYDGRKREKSWRRPDIPSQLKTVLDVSATANDSKSEPRVIP
jgi:hypothetical protein